MFKCFRNNFEELEECEGSCRHCWQSQQSTPVESLRWTRCEFNICLSCFHCHKYIGPLFSQYDFRYNLNVSKRQDYDLHEAPQNPSGGPLLIEASINLSNILEVEILLTKIDSHLGEEIQVRNTGGRETAADKS